MSASKDPSAAITFVWKSMYAIYKKSRDVALRVKKPGS